MKSRCVFFRLSLTEYQQLVSIAADDEETLSELVRSALYRCYERRGLGTLAVNTPTTPPPFCQTPLR